MLPEVGLGNSGMPMNISATPAAPLIIELMVDLVEAVEAARRLLRVHPQAARVSD
jgi:hypothetical protein